MFFRCQKKKFKKRGYKAEILIGIDNNGDATLYDIVKITPKK